jgi:hypothetical protein
VQPGPTAPLRVAAAVVCSRARFRSASWPRARDSLALVVVRAAEGLDADHLPSSPRQWRSPTNAHSGVVSGLGHLRPEGGDVGDLPRLDHLAIAEVGDHRLIDSEVAACALDPTEGRSERPRDDDASHLHVAIDKHFLDLMAQVGHGGQCVPPHCLLLIRTRCREASRRVDDRSRMEQPIEGVEVTGITSSEPAEHDGGGRIAHARSLALRADPRPDIHRARNDEVHLAP